MNANSDFAVLSLQRFLFLCFSGKSTIIKRLRGEGIGENLSTVGVELSEWSFTPKRNTKPVFNFNVWDFGGQEEYYATHQCFLTRRSLYLLLWKITDGPSGVNGLRPWLDNLAARAPGSPLLIIATHTDCISREKRESGYIKAMRYKVRELVTLPQYKSLHVTTLTEVSCLTGWGIDDLRADIYRAAEEYQYPKGHNVMGEKVPASYIRLDELVHEKRSELARQKAPQILRSQELRSVMRKRGLDDIEGDEELQLASEHLHNVGTMLHYPDRASGLDDLYFIDPRWLCDMMSVVVTVRERNPYVGEGLLSRTDAPQLFKGDRFPVDYFPQYMALLNRFEIAVPLDDETILIPSMLPLDPPDGLPMLHPSFVNPSLTLRRLYCMRGIPAGLWSRLMARLLQRLQETIEGMGLLKGRWYDSRQRDAQQSPESGRRPSNEPVTAYWRHGLCFNHEKLAFMVRQLTSGLGGRADGCGLEVVTSVGPNGRHLMVLLVDEISKLIGEWYPGLEPRDMPGMEPNMETVVPCYHCIEIGIPFPFMFDFDVLAAVAGRQQTISCPNHPDNASRLENLVPELLFLDLPQHYLLSKEQVKYSKDEDSILGHGTFGCVFRGTIANNPQEVAIKVFKESPSMGVKGAFTTLRQEVISRLFDFTMWLDSSLHTDEICVQQDITLRACMPIL